MHAVSFTPNARCLQNMTLHAQRTIRAALGAFEVIIYQKHLCT
jgi:hypothetical protein